MPVFRSLHCSSSIACRAQQRPAVSLSPGTITLRGEKTGVCNSHLQQLCPSDQPVTVLPCASICPLAPQTVPDARTIHTYMCELIVGAVILQSYCAVALHQVGLDEPCAHKTARQMGQTDSRLGTLTAWDSQAVTALCTQADLVACAASWLQPAVQAVQSKPGAGYCCTH
jgi:hypothetical protein